MRTRNSKCNLQGSWGVGRGCGQKVPNAVGGTLSTRGAGGSIQNDPDAMCYNTLGVRGGVDKKFQTQDHALGTREAGGLADKKLQSQVARNVSRGDTGGGRKVPNARPCVWHTWSGRACGEEVPNAVGGTLSARGGAHTKRTRRNVLQCPRRERGGGQKVPKARPCAWHTGSGRACGQEVPNASCKECGSWGYGGWTKSSKRNTMRLAHGERAGLRTRSSKCNFRRS